MIIYGVALLAGCSLVGLYVGELLGKWLGVQANVGGVGIAMLLLVLASSSTLCKPLVSGESATGIRFWSAMYIPIIVAMAAGQNVVAAVDGGLLALLAGALATISCFLLVPVLSKLGPQGTPLPPLAAADDLPALRSPQQPAQQKSR